MKTQAFRILLLILVAIVAIPALSFAADSCKHVIRQNDSSGGYSYCADNTYPYYFDRSNNVPGHHLRDYGTEDSKYQNNNPDRSSESREGV